MQFTSERFQTYFQEACMSQHTTGAYFAAYKACMWQPEEPHTAPDPPLLHHVHPCLQKGHKRVRVTNILLALKTGRTQDGKVKKPMFHGAVEHWYRLIYACLAAALHAPSTSLCNWNYDIPPPQKVIPPGESGKSSLLLAGLVSRQITGFQLPQLTRYSAAQPSALA